MSAANRNRPAFVSRRALGAFPSLLLVLACTALPAGAQLRPVAIQGATILVGDGTTIESGTILIKGGKISEVGSAVEAPFLARKVAAKGCFVTPGFIDLHSTVGQSPAPGGGDAVGHAADAFDRYANHDLRAALQQGITAIYAPARSPSGVGGVGAVLRLIPRGSPDEVLLRDNVGLCANMGADERIGPLARARATVDLRRRLQAAKDYRASWEDYEESLKEYETKVVERAKKAAEEAKKAAKDATAKKAAGEEGEKPKEPKKDEKAEELKKPPEPGKDRNAEVLLKVLDGELRLCIAADEPADILNAIQLAEDFNLALIIQGGAGADLVAGRLAERGVPVIWSGPTAPLAYTPSVSRLATPDGAARLRNAGVQVYFGSGMVPPGAAPQLALRVARAVGQGFDADAALRSLTAEAARLLGVEKDVGRVKPGLDADLVIWSDHPFAPGAHVEHVFIAGKEVYRADREIGEGEE